MPSAQSEKIKKIKKNYLLRETSSIKKRDISIFGRLLGQENSMDVGEDTALGNDDSSQQFVSSS